MSRDGASAVYTSFLPRGAAHNLSVCPDRTRGRIGAARVDDSGRDLHEGCRGRAMALANGVDADDPALAACRTGTCPARSGKRAAPL